jgi:hypothetical protein
MSDLTTVSLTHPVPAFFMHSGTSLMMMPGSLVRFVATLTNVSSKVMLDSYSKPMVCSLELCLPTDNCKMLPPLKDSGRWPAKWAGPSLQKPIYPNGMGSGPFTLQCNGWTCCSPVRVLLLVKKNKVILRSPFFTPISLKRYWKLVENAYAGSQEISFAVHTKVLIFWPCLKILFKLFGTDIVRKEQRTFHFSRVSQF